MGRKKLHTKEYKPINLHLKKDIFIGLRKLMQEEDQMYLKQFCEGILTETVAMAKQDGII